MTEEETIEPKSPSKIKADSALTAGSVAETQTSGELSNDEQMAKFEEALMEADWGHQPC